MDRSSFIVTMFMSYAAMAGDCVPEWDTQVGSPGAASAVAGLATVDLGEGPELLAFGSFTTIGGAPASRLASWDGSEWKALVEDINAQVSDTTIFEGQLWIGGAFTQIGSGVRSMVARRVGEDWQAAGPGFNRPVRALKVVDGELYAGGGFWLSGGEGVRGVGRWDGSQWAPLAGGLIGEVYDLATDPTGALLAAGDFQFALGGPEVNHIARWDGAAWGAVSSGLDDVVRVARTFDLGDGPAIYAGGDFTGNAAVNRGGGWETLGAGPGGPINDLAVADLGDGPVLLAAGRFGSASTGGGLAAWDGQSWSLVSGGLTVGTSTIEALALCADDEAGTLAVAGRFDAAGGVVSKNIALLTLCDESNPADLSGDGTVNAADLALLLAAWGTCGGCAADLGADGAVNAADLAVLLAAWG